MIDNCVVKFRLSNGTWKITTFCINQGQYVNKFKTDLASSYRFNTNFMAILSSFYNHFQYGFQTNPVPNVLAKKPETAKLCECNEACCTFYERVEPTLASSIEVEFIYLRNVLL